jgi:hypothetical protein
MLNSSVLPKAEQFFGSIYGKSLVKNDLWPLPFLQLQSFTKTKGDVNGWHSVDLTFTITTVPSI